MVCAIAVEVHLASVVQAFMLSWPLVRDAVGLRGTVIDEAVSRLRRHARAAFSGNRCLVPATVSSYITVAPENNHDS
jgi:hypothetical protein